MVDIDIDSLYVPDKGTFCLKKYSMQKYSKTEYYPNEYNSFFFFLINSDFFFTLENIFFYCNVFIYYSEIFISINYF